MRTSMPSDEVCIIQRWVSEAKEWVAARAGKEQQVETVKGALRNFLVEPFVPHPQGTEYYININSVRDVRLLQFSLWELGR